MLADTRAKTNHKRAVMAGILGCRKVLFGDNEQRRDFGTNDEVSHPVRRNITKRKVSFRCE